MKAEDVAFFLPRMHCSVKKDIVKNECKETAEDQKKMEKENSFLV